MAILGTGIASFDNNFARPSAETGKSSGQGPVRIKDVNIAENPVEQIKILIHVCSGEKLVGSIYRIQGHNCQFKLCLYFIGGRCFYRAGGEASLNTMGASREKEGKYDALKNEFNSFHHIRHSEQDYRLFNDLLQR